MPSPQERLICTVFFIGKAEGKKKHNPRMPKLVEAFRARAAAERADAEADADQSQAALTPTSQNQTRNRAT